jgi:hypothetical protein
MPSVKATGTTPPSWSSTSHERNETLKKAQQAPQVEHGFNFNGETSPLRGGIDGRALDDRSKKQKSGQHILRANPAASLKDGLLKRTSMFRFLRGQDLGVPSSGGRDGTLPHPLPIGSPLFEACQIILKSIK